MSVNWSNTDRSLTATQKQVIGKGMAFPKMINPARGSTNTSEGYERIAQSIRVILGTPVGSRIGNRSFGSKLNTLVFEPNDFILADLLKLYIFEALTEWEPRIKVQEVDVIRDPVDANRLNCGVYYILKNSNLEGNYVFPFDKPETMR